MFYAAGGEDHNSSNQPQPCRPSAYVPPDKALGRCRALFAGSGPGVITGRREVLAYAHAPLRVGKQLSARTHSPGDLIARWRVQRMNRRSSNRRCRSQHRGEHLAKGARARSSAPDVGALRNVQGGDWAVTSQARVRGVRGSRAELEKSSG